MLYDLSKDTDLQRATKRFKQLSEQRAVIELKEKRKRPTSQSRYLHLILSWYGMELGYTMDESKQLFKELNSDIFAYLKSDKTFYKSTADTTTEELTKAIEKFRNDSSMNAGIYLPSANEHLFLEEIEIEASKNNYL